jgi:hypothetical protein
METTESQILQQIKPTDMEAVIDLYGEIPTADFFRLLGRIWTKCENVGAYLSELRKIFEENPISRLQMMSPKDLARYSALPNEIRVYRGCSSVNRLGMSFSLNRRTACHFAFARGYHQVDEQALLLEAIIEKTSCVLLTAQGESEVVWVPRQGNFKQENLLIEHLMGPRFNQDHWNS